MNNIQTLREAYGARKISRQEQDLHEVRELLEEHVLIVEKLDTSTISRIVDAMNGVEEAIGPMIDKLPSLKQGLDKAEAELASLASGSGGNNPNKTGKMLAKAMSFYQNLSSFLKHDLSVVLKSRIFANAKASPDAPIGTKATPVFLQALKLNWKDRSGGFLKKLFAGSDIPYIDNNSFSQELSNLTYNQLLSLTKVGQAPPVVTQAQINQAVAQAVSPAASPAGATPNLTATKDAIAKALEPHMGSNIPDEVLTAVIKAVQG